MKELIKSIILRFLTLNQYIKFIEKRVRRSGITQSKKIDKNIFFKLLSRGNERVSFVQIGSNDGVKNDPIYEFVKRYNWKGVLVEPLPKLFNTLIKNYNNISSLTFENVGISNEIGEMDFYYLPASFNEPDWLQQIGSFDRSAIEYNLENYPHLIEKINSIPIKTITLQELFIKNNIYSLDLLIIDAEGFEYKILSQLQNVVAKPNFILFEWGCLNEKDRQLLYAYLENCDYELYLSEGDILAIKNNKS